MKIKYIRNDRKLNPEIKRIYTLVLELGYSINRIYHRADNGTVVLRMYKGMDTRKVILCPPNREIFVNGHGEKI